MKYVAIFVDGPKDGEQDPIPHRREWLRFPEGDMTHDYKYIEDQKTERGTVFMRFDYVGKGISPF